MPPQPERNAVLIDVDLPDHPKYLGLSDAAKVCLYESLLWARKYQTDGFVPNATAIAKWSLQTLDELCANDAEKPSLIRTETGYLIHDFTDWNPTRAQLEARREAYKAAGREGGKASAQARGKRSLKRSSTKRLSDRQANASARPPAPAETPYGVSSSGALQNAPPDTQNGAPRYSAPAARRDWADVEADRETVDPAAGARAARFDAIDACQLCDHEGYRLTTDGRPGNVCDHVDHTLTARRGSKAVRAAIEATRKANQ